MTNISTNSTDGLANVQGRGMALIERLIAVAHPSAVFGEPITAGEYTVITAAEVSLGTGFGFGSGSRAEPDQPAQPSQSGGGLGGGGGAMARPVAVITVGPEGVQVEPIVDRTKIALAFFTLLGGIALTMHKMIKASRD